MVSCPDCDRDFESEKGMKIHRGQKHDPKVDVECKCCEDVFRVQPHREDTAKFCSVQCRADWQQEHYRGEAHDNYVDGSTMLYGGTIAKTRWLRLAEKARERDGYECSKCGISNEECWEEYNQSLSVHHKVKPEEYTGDDPHDMSNLETLCASCHQSEHVEGGKAGTQ